MRTLIFGQIEGGEGRVVPLSLDTRFRCGRAVAVRLWLVLPSDAC